MIAPRKKRRRSWFNSLWILLIAFGALFAVVFLVAAGVTFRSLLMRSPPSRTAPANPPAPRASFSIPPAAAAANYVAPRPSKQFVPDTTLLAPGLIHELTRVELRLEIDEQGRVTGVRIANSGREISQALADSAIASAKRWTFEPATLDGRPVASEHTVVFEFHPQTAQ